MLQLNFCLITYLPNPTKHTDIRFLLIDKSKVFCCKVEENQVALTITGMSEFLVGTLVTG